MAIPSPLSILLPACKESTSDVFFNVIRNSIARSKLDEHYLDNALKCGVGGEEFEIEADDVAVDWGQLQSDEQLIRQSKILGYWAVEHFPALGKKFFGTAWLPSDRQHVQVVGQPDSVSPGDIDKMVFKKMKLRLMELHVSESTANKLKHFAVDAVATMVRSNEHQMSPKIKSWDIEGEDCWKTLKLGVTSLRSQSVSKIQNGKVGSNSDKLSVGSNKKGNEHKRTQNDGNDTEESSDNFRSTSKRIHLDIDPTTNDANNRMSPGESSANTNEGALQEIHREIGKITSLIRSTWASREPNIGSENLYVTVINQKEAEIARLTVTAEELSQVNGILKKDFEQQKELIYALQKGVDATSKLLEQSDRDSAVNLDLIETLKVEIAHLKAQNAEIGTKNENLRAELQSLDSQNSALIVETRGFMDQLKSGLTEARASNSRFIEENGKLQVEVETLKEQISQPQNRSEAETQTDLFTEVPFSTGHMSSPCNGLESTHTTELTSKSQLSSASHFPSEPNDDDNSNDNVELDAGMIVSDNEADSVTDPIVVACREGLLKLPFGWMKFQRKKTSKFFPAFIWPADNDGIERAQKVTNTGYVGNVKKPFYEFTQHLPENLKDQQEIDALAKFNQKFNTSFV